MGRPRSLQELLPAARRVLRHFGPEVRRQRALATASVAALLVEVLLRLLEPWPLKVVFDRLLGAHGRDPLGTTLAALPPMALLLGAVLAVVIVGALRAVAAYYTAVGFALIGNRVLTDVRQKLYQHLQQLSLSFHARSGSGELVVRVIGDVGLLKEAAVTALLPMLASMFVLLGMASVMLLLDVRLGLLALAVLPLFAVSTLGLGRQIHDVARVQRQREGNIAAQVAESMTGVNTVKSLSLEGAFSGMFARDSARSLKEGVKGKRLEAKLERSADLLTALATALVLGYGTLLALRQAITPGDLIVFLSYLKTAFRPVRDFAKYAGRLAKATAAGERVVDLLERVPDVTDRPGAVAAPALRGAVRFEGVGFAYEPGHPVLHDVSLDVAPGQRVAVVGPSGSGKSTLIGMLLRLHDPATGQVLLDGRDLRDYTLASVRAQVTVVLQDALLFRGTVRDNISCAVSGATEEQILAAARVAGADDFIGTLPQGYDTMVGERGVMLSAGQRQRIAIARAAMRRAPLIVLDEPTTGLDAENQRLVTEALARLSADCTTFLVTHDPAVAATADLVVRLEDGRIVAQSPSELGADRPAGDAAPQVSLASVAPQRTALSPADEALIRREGDLPGLGFVLDTERVRDRLASLWPEAGVSAARAVYLRYKPRTSCIVSYRMTTSGGEIDVHATARARSDDQKLAKARERACSNHDLRLFVLEDCAVVVSVFPEDARLPGLRWLDSPEKRQDLRRRLLGRDVSPGALTRLRYKPERRWVGCLSGGNAPPVFLKAYAAPEFENGLLGSLLQSNEPALRIPRRLGINATKGLLALEWIDGRPLGEALHAGEAGEEETRCAGEALARLHRQPPHRLPLRTRSIKAEHLISTADTLGFLQPDLADRARALMLDLAIRLAALPRCERLVHGDFHSGQMLLTGGVPMMIDFDEAALGDPAEDLGSFLAHLECDEIAGLLATPKRSAVAAALVEGYARTASPPPEHVLRLHTGAVLFQRATQFFRDRDPLWPERTGSVLDRVESLLRDSSRSRAPAVVNGTGLGGPGLLEAALDLATVQQHFRELPNLQARLPGLVVRGARVLRHKPGRRALVEYELAGKGPQEHMHVLGKIRARGADHRTYRLCRHLVGCGFGPRSEDGISVPEPLGVVPELGMWLQARVPGSTATVLMAGTSGRDVAARLADALHKLNRAPVAVSRNHGVADELAILHELLGRLACERRQWGDRLERLLEGCTRLAAGLGPAVPAIVHRDFYPAQAVVDGDRVYLVDLDLCAWGDPALDIGNCLGHLVEQGLREDGDPAALEGPAQALAHRFALYRGLRALTAADTYTTFTLARHVWLSTQIPGRETTTGALLDLCEQRLGLATLQSVGTAAAREGVL
jgi:ATP-binding cassette, subfamily B, bacterial